MLTPDILFDSYRDITPAFLQGQGVTLLLTDLDATFESDPAAASKEEILFAYPGLFAPVDRRLEGRRDHRDDRVEQPIRRSRDRVLRRSGHRLSGPCQKAQSKGPAGRYGANRNRSGPHRHVGR